MDMNQFAQFVVLFLTTMGGTGLLKVIASKLSGTPLGGNAARYVSIIAGILLVGAGMVVGAIHIPLPAACRLDAPYMCVDAWLGYAALVVTAANLAYDQVWQRIKPSPEEPPVPDTPAKLTNSTK